MPGAALAVVAMSGMVKQLSLMGMMQGKVEIVKDQEKRKPGRPPKAKGPEEGVEEKVKNPVGRLKKLRQVDADQELVLNELMEQFMSIEEKHILLLAIFQRTLVSRKRL